MKEKQTFSSRCFFSLCILLVAVFFVNASSAPDLELLLQKHVQHQTDFNNFEFPNSQEADVNRNITELITSKGYTCENHYVVTPDGYVLGVQRIPASPSSPRNPSKRVVYLQHGILDSATTWAVNFPSQSLAFILADHGYDVWLGNVRGNTYSRTNIHHPVDSTEFWSFSWDEHAFVDLPAVVDYILERTSQSKLAYVGHSQGGAMGFSAFSTSKALADKISIFVALAPVTYLSHPGSPIIKFLADIKLDSIIKFFGFKEFLPDFSILQHFIPGACSIAGGFCKNAYCALFGCESQFVNVTRLPVYLSHVPSGTSVQNMAHWAQIVRARDFVAYDFGSTKENMNHYNQPTAPSYKISNLGVKTVVYYGTADPLSTVDDVNYWLTLIPQDKLHSKVIEGYGHCDFVWGVDAADRVYHEAIQYIAESFERL